MNHLLSGLLLLAALFGAAAPLAAQAAGGFTVNIGGGPQGDLTVALQLVIFMTLLTLAPSIVMLMTSFTRIVIVLGFLRNAIGVPTTPSNQIIVGLSLFLTLFIMGPTWNRIYEQAYLPYEQKQIESREALEIAGGEMKAFMLKQTRPKDLQFFAELAAIAPTDAAELPLRVVTPAFILSELRTAFQMGFLIFIPFIVVDFLVSAVLMAMGMIMMPPVVISLPFKLLLFVLVDGWTLIIGSLVRSFQI